MSGAHNERRLSFRQWLRYRRYYRTDIRDRRRDGWTITPYQRDLAKARARKAARKVDE